MEFNSGVKGLSTHRCTVIDYYNKV